MSDVESLREAHAREKEREDAEIAIAKEGLKIAEARVSALKGPKTARQNRSEINTSVGTETGKAIARRRGIGNALHSSPVASKSLEHFRREDQIRRAGDDFLNAQARRLRQVRVDNDIRDSLRPEPEPDEFEQALTFLGATAGADSGTSVLGEKDARSQIAREHRARLLGGLFK